MTDGFTIIFYKNSSPKNQLKKSIKEVITFEGCICKENTDIINPTFTLNAALVGTESDPSIARCNYVYVANWGRYYFINDIVTTPGKMQEVHCTVDVLMSFSDDIKQCEGIVQSNQNSYNLYIDDGSFTCYQDPYIITRNFPNGFSKDGTYVLTVSGG